MADEKKIAPAEDDKSINELLKEYAEDVKDKDLDDFLKGAEDDDAFENDEDAAEEESEKVLAAAGAPRKKGGGFLTMLLIVIAFGAAGAGAYVYLNRDDGMTSIMGGFMGGSNTNDMTMESVVPPAPADTNAADTGATPAMPEAPTQPMPIVNEAPTVDVQPMPSMPAPDATASVPATTAPAPGADLLAVPVTGPEGAPAMPAPPAANAAAETLPPAGDVNASQAVDAWMSGNANAPAVTDTKAPLPEKTIAEIKAKPPTTAKPAKVKDTVAITPAAAPKKKEYVTSPELSGTADGALPPPYMAIQAKKGGAAVTPATASSKMAPVVEGDVKHSASGTGRDEDGNTNKNVSDVSKATGDTAAMVANGGGMIEIPVQGVPAPVGMLPTRSIQPAPQMRTVPLAIQGGKSLPPGANSVETTAYAELPATNAGTSPAMKEPRMPAMPVEPVRTTNPEPADDETPSMPASSSSDEQDARAIVAQAVAAEKAGRSGDALELYQKALEADAIYGDGQSIDRGMVYDRIGAIRAGH